jgi:hypothetical protein
MLLVLRELVAGREEAVDQGLEIGEVRRGGERGERWGGGGL